MTLLEVIRNLDSFDDDHAICASRPWAIDSDTIVGDHPREMPILEIEVLLGKPYLLDVHTAKEAVDGWRANVKSPHTAEELCKVVIHYAEHDAWPVFENNTGKLSSQRFVKLEFKNRRWYDWILIVFGIGGLILQLVILMSTKSEQFSWLNVMVSGIFLWFGTVPRKTK